METDGYRCINLRKATFFQMNLRCKRRRDMEKYLEWPGTILLWLLASFEDTIVVVVGPCQRLKCIATEPILDLHIDFEVKPSQSAQPSLKS